MTTIVWFRRDLRLYDHHALSQALKHQKDVLPLFIFDSEILSKLPPHDKRVTFIIESLQEISQTLKKKGSDIFITKGDVIESWKEVIKKFHPTSVYFNEDYEPYAQKRDQEVLKLLNDSQIKTHIFKDHVIFSPKEILKKDHSPYKVFTPYKNAWLKKLDLTDSQLPSHPVHFKNLYQWTNHDSISLFPTWFKKLNFIPQTNILKGGSAQAKARLKQFLSIIQHYHIDRDYPFKKGTSFLSVDLRMGTLSIRHLLTLTLKERSKKGEGPTSYLNELIWREFYQMILYQFPHVQTRPFKVNYENIEWDNNKEHFKQWCQGQTGVPIVDASMRCLNATGMMPNRFRMVVANFLCKILFIHWQWGEEYFALKLLDFDLAANNGGWQWSSSTGADAAPYFRIFNPYTQSKKFDPDGVFIKKWVPELNELSSKELHRPEIISEHILKKSKIKLGKTYPFPIVNYENQRLRTIEKYKNDLSK